MQGSGRDIREVLNAIEVYEAIEQWSATSERDYLKAHGVLLAGSGVRYVDVYRDTLTSDTSGFAALLIGRFPAGDTLFIDVMPSDTIHLFTRAVDGVGNEELLNWTEGITAMIEWGHIPVVCAADFDEDEMVSIADLLGLLSSYGTSDATYDLTGDGEVGLADFFAFLQQYGTFCPN